MPRLRKRIVVFGALALLVLIAALIAAYLYLPKYAETRLIPQLARTLGFTAQAVNVQSIGFTGANLGPLRIGGGRGLALSLERLHVSYSPLTLLQGKINRIRLEGLRTRLRIENGTFFLDDQPVWPRPAVTEKPAAPAILPALPFRRFSITDAMLDIDWEGRPIAMPFTLEVDAVSQGRGRWRVEGIFTPPNSRAHMIAHADIAAGQIRIDLKEARTSLETWADLIPTGLLPDEIEFAVAGRATARGRATFQVDPPSFAAGHVEIALEESKVHSRSPALALTFPLVRIQTELQPQPGGVALSGRMQIEKARLADQVHQLDAEGITLDLPFAWPAGQNVAPGQLAVSRIVFQKMDMGDLSGALTQRGEAIQFDLAHHSQLLSDLNVLIRGTADGNAADVDVEIPTYEPATPIDLGRYAKAAQGLSLAGRFTGEGKLHWRPTTTRTSARLRIDDGTLRDEERDLLLTGIQIEVRLDDALAPHSPAGQSLQVAALNLGKIASTDFQMEFQIAPPANLMIKKAGLAWSGGRIETDPMVLTPDASSIEATLIVRDINLAMMLEQLDLAEGSGQGTLGGRLPIRWANGNLTFDRGALASPAGQSGTIRLKELQGTQDLLAGLPEGTPQHTQLDIAMEALKDYTYQNIELQVESQAEDLVLRLQLAGKPNRTLPFAYDQEIGQLKRVHGGGQAEFQHIDIDLNFRSQLNQMLHYRELLKPQ